MNLLVLDQENPVKVGFKSVIDIRNEIDFDDIGRYHSIWPFMTKNKGG